MADLVAIATIKGAPSIFSEGVCVMNSIDEGWHNTVDKVAGHPLPEGDRSLPLRNRGYGQAACRDGEKEECERRYTCNFPGGLNGQEDRSCRGSWYYPHPLFPGWLVYHRYVTLSASQVHRQGKAQDYCL